MSITTRAGVLLCAWLLVRPAGAEQYQTFAPVLKVEPVLETHYEPVQREVCSEPDPAARGFWESAATIGEDIRRQIRHWQQQRRCRIVTEQQAREQITAYRVTYRYRSETRTTLLSYDPGEQLRVQVSLSPQR